MQDRERVGFLAVEIVNQISWGAKICFVLLYFVDVLLILCLTASGLLAWHATLSCVQCLCKL